MCFCFGKTQETDSFEECTICFEEINRKNKGYAVNCCGNYYHHKCITEWLKKHNTCPTCKRVAKSALPLSNNCYIEFFKTEFALVNRENRNQVLVSYSDLKNLNETNLNNGYSKLCIELTEDWGGTKYNVRSETSIIVLIKSTLSNLR